jgi:opacity protein-like surface antigen
MGFVMKKVLIIMLVSFFSLGIASNCFADSYFAGNFGFVSVEDAGLNNPAFTAVGITGTEISFDNGIGLSLAVGSKVDSLRYEGEFSYRTNDMDTISANDMGTPVSIPVNGDITAMTLMGNIYGDINTDSAVTPFIGIGLGFSKLDGDLEGDSENDTVFAYQLILGTGFKVNDTTNIDVSYRYFATADAEFDGTEIEYATHNIMVGARFSF